MIKRICRVCGKEFETNSNRQLDCKKTVIRKCVICGDEFEATCSVYDTRLSCGKKSCVDKLSYEKRVASFENETKICKLCGKEFHPSNNTQVYCKRMHEVICPICGNEFIVDTRKNDFRKTCSSECATKLKFINGNPLQGKENRKKIKEKYLEKTGYDHPMHNPEVLNKMKQTTLNRYGKEHFVQTELYKERAIQTNLEKYGTEWPSQSQEIKNKVTATNIDKYGVSNIMKSKETVDRMKMDYLERTGYEWSLKNPEVREKIYDTNEKKYGSRQIFGSKEIREKSKRTMLERYGVESPLQSKEILNKVKETCLEKYGNTSYVGSKQGRNSLMSYMRKKYGVDFYSQTSNWKIERIENPECIEAYKEFLSDPNSFLDKFDHKLTLNELSNLIGVGSYTINYWLNKYGIYDRIKYTLSKMEEDVINEIKSIDAGIKIVRHERSKIKPMELDIYLPDFNFAIECNPTATHNSSVFDPFGGAPKDRNYHKKKTLRCNEKGIFLFHIFGYEWTHRKDIILSMIRHILKKDMERIYARNCTVKEIDHDSCKIFLDHNHIQGSTNASIRIGLYHNDDLVSVMTFGKMRGTMGTGNSDLKDCFELSRFCNKVNTSVVGGASKMFKYFINKYKISRVRSFSDLSHTSGGIYDILGFKKIHTTLPQYVWVDFDTDYAYNRVNTQKNKLKKFLQDDDIDLSKTEKQIMEEHGFVQVFDSGKILWEWNTNSPN